MQNKRNRIIKYYKKKGRKTYQNKLNNGLNLYHIKGVEYNGI